MAVARVVLPTMDILLQVLTSDIMHEEECNGSGKEVKDKISRLINTLDSLAVYAKYKVKKRSGLIN